jgi:hypothetical protein
MDDAEHQLLYLPIDKEECLPYINEDKGLLMTIFLIGGSDQIRNVMHETLIHGVSIDGKCYSAKEVEVIVEPIKGKCSYFRSVSSHSQLALHSSKPKYMETQIQPLIDKAKCQKCGKYLVWRWADGFWRYMPLNKLDEGYHEGKDCYGSEWPHLHPDCRCDDEDAFGNLTEEEIEILSKWLEDNY